MKSPWKCMLTACVGICAALASIDVQAEGQPYVEVGYAWIQLSSDGYDVTTTDGIGRLGYDFTKNLSGTIVGSTSFSNGELHGVTVKVDAGYGAYLKGRVADVRSTKSKEEATIIISHSGRSTYPEEKSVQTSGATRA